MSMGNGSASYRAEIDGLRALAVLAVILNHIDPHWLPSGYLGVDIFFVISGYVITASLARRPTNSLRELLAGFYARRLRRLVPALLACILLTAVVMALVIPSGSDDSERYWRTGLSSLVGFSNLYLYRQSTDYFATATAYNPFTHTWSLGVEEQFYFLFPLLIWICGFGANPRRGVNRLIGILAGLGVVSLGLFLLWGRSNPSAAYFLLPARFWEIGAGALLWCLGPGLSSRFRPLISLAATVLLIGSLWLPEAWRMLPTLLVVLGTVAWIASVRSGQWIHRCFSHPWLVGIGVISYSLYLWHWSVLTLGRWTIGLTPATLPWLVALMFGLALLSFRCLESPLRRATWSGGRLGTIGWGLGSILVAALVLIGGIRPLAARVYLGSTPQPDGRFNYRTCHFDADLASGLPADPDLPSCRLPASSPERPTWFFLGDSHSSHLAGLARRVHRTLDVGVVKAGVAWMPTPELSFVRETGEGTVVRSPARNQELIRFQQRLESAVLKAIRPGDVLVISDRLSYYFGRERIKRSEREDRLTFLSPGGTPLSLEAARALWLRELDRLVNSLERRDVAVVVLLPTPEFDLAAPVPLAACSPEWFRGRPDPACRASVPRAAFEQHRRELRGDLEALAMRHPNLTLLDPLPTLCPGKEGTCTNLLQGRQIYRDGDHLNEAGSALLVEALPATLLKQGR